MYKLKPAIKKAGELSEKAKDLKRAAVSNWAREGIISGIVDYEIDENTGGRSGLYPDSLPIEIAVTAELKKDYKLSKIKTAREEAQAHLKDPKDRDYKGAIEELNKRLGERISAPSEQGIDNEIKSMDFVIEAIKRTKLTMVYVKKYNYFKEKFNEGGAK